jgi:hypothetical protein
MTSVTAITVNRERFIGFLLESGQPEAFHVFSLFLTVVVSRDVNPRGLRATG